MAVFLGVGAGPVVIFINKDAHLRQELHLLLIQVFRVYLRHSERRLSLSHLTASTIV